MRFITVGQLFIAALTAVLYLQCVCAATPLWHMAAREAWVQEMPVAIAGPARGPLHDRQIRLTADGDDRYEHLIERVTAARSGEHAVQISISLDPRYQELVIHSLRLTHGTQPVTTFNAAQLGAVLDSQSAEAEPGKRQLNPRLQLRLALPNALPGDLLECEYTVHSRAARFAGLFAGHYAAQWSRGDPPAQWERLRVIWPAGRTVQYRLSGGGAPQVSSRDGELLLEWRGMSPAAAAETDTPRWFETRSTVQLSDFGDWSAVAALLAAQYGNPDPALQTQPGRPDVPAMIRNAMQLVQSKVHALTVGEGPYLPADPAVVLQRGFGDSRDLARLLASLLQRVGIDARVALADSRRGALLDSRLPSPFILDSALVFVRNGTTEYWINPTAGGSDASLDTTDTAGLRHALLLSTHDGKVVTLPPPASDSRLRIVQQQFDLSAGNGHPATLSVTTQIHGSWAQSVRAQLAAQSPAQLQLGQIQSVVQDYPDATAQGQARLQDIDEGRAVQVTARFEIPKALHDSADPHFDFFAEGLADAVAPRDEATREWPLGIAWPLQLEEHITAALPEHFVAPVGSMQIEDTAFRYQRVVRLSGRTLEIAHRYVTLADHVDPQDYPKYVLANAAVYEALAVRVRPAKSRGSQLLEWLAGHGLELLVVLIVTVMLAGALWRRMRRT